MLASSRHRRLKANAANASGKLGQAERDRGGQRSAELEALGPSHENPRRLARINASAKARAPSSQDRLSKSCGEHQPSLKACDPAEAPAHQDPISERPKAWLSSRAKPAGKNTSSALPKPETTRDTARTKARQKQQGCFGEALVVLDPLTPLNAALLALEIMPKRSLCAAASLHGCGGRPWQLWSIAWSGHCPARGRDLGVDETNDIQPIRHNALPFLPTAGAKGAKGVRIRRTRTLRARDPS